MRFFQGDRESAQYCSSENFGLRGEVFAVVDDALAQMPPGTVGVPAPTWSRHGMGFARSSRTRIRRTCGEDRPARGAGLDARVEVAGSSDRPTANKALARAGRECGRAAPPAAASWDLSSSHACAFMVSLLRRSTADRGSVQLLASRLNRRDCAARARTLLDLDLPDEMLVRRHQESPRAPPRSQPMWSTSVSACAPQDRCQPSRHPGGGEIGKTVEHAALVDPPVCGRASGSKA
jgi:hypothetical protein